jgi:hypothetical protein
MAANAKIIDPQVDWSEQVKSIRLEVDQDRARALGRTPQDVAQTLQTLLSSYTVMQYREGIEHIEVVARGRLRTPRAHPAAGVDHHLQEWRRARLWSLRSDGRPSSPKAGHDGDPD